jgi:hypothetical protein
MKVDQMKILKSINFFIEKKIYFLKFNYRFLQAEIQGRERIILYQMGKVGSSTIFKSFCQLGLDKNFALHRVYYFTQEGLEFVEKYVGQTYGDFINFPYSFKNQIWRSSLLRNKLDKNYLKTKKCKVITLVREPISRNISAFFQTLDWFVTRKEDEFPNREAYLQEVARCFWEKYPHDIPLTWFDDEPKRALEIDVFASEFPKSKGYKIYRGEFADLLLLKLEKLNECSQQAIAEFLGIDNFVLDNANVGRRKQYSETYTDLLSSITIPKSYINKMYDSKYTKHFYSAQEIEFFQQKWLKSSSKQTTY